MNSTVAAIDLGYGHTKCAVHTSGTTVEDSFPSFCADASGQASGLTGGGMSRLRVVRVEVGDKAFLVGQDSILATDGRQERLRDPAYCTTSQYTALMLGALTSMRQPVIDVLVLGLPITTYSTYRELLESRFTGRHRLPASHTLGIDEAVTSVDVRKVLVAPQPAGALVAMAAEQPEIKQDMNLVVDLGYFTMDYLVANGIKPAARRSGAVEGGMSGYFDVLHEAAAKDFAKIYGGMPGEFRMSHHQYEQALVRGDNMLRTSAGALDLSSAVQAASRKLDEYLDSVAARIGNSGDIINVVLAGGGAELIRPRFKVRFPRMANLFTPKRPQFAICQGLLHLGLGIAGVRK